tara:strand:- start:156 stop:317 length:162 start_codon:yes stop_codon:yes gene_type:complete
MKTPNRTLPVDMSETFYKEGWEYCRYLITDPRSDAYLKMGRKNASTKLETSLQ